MTSSTLRTCRTCVTLVTLVTLVALVALRTLYALRARERKLSDVKPLIGCFCAKRTREDVHIKWLCGAYEDGVAVFSLVGEGIGEICVSWHFVDDLHAKLIEDTFLFEDVLDICLILCDLLLQIAVNFAVNFYCHFVRPPVFL